MKTALGVRHQWRQGQIKAAAAALTLLVVAALMAASPALAQSTPKTRWRVTPLTLNFGKAPAGSTKTFSIANISKPGADPLNVFINNPTGAGANAFSVSPSGALPPINVGDPAAIITVTFNPVQLGPSGVAKIKVTSNAIPFPVKNRDATAIVTARGIAISTPTSTPTATPTPTATATSTSTATPTATPTGAPGPDSGLGSRRLDLFKHIWW